MSRSTIWLSLLFVIGPTIAAEAARVDVTPRQVKSEGALGSCHIVDVEDPLWNIEPCHEFVSSGEVFFHFTVLDQVTAVRGLIRGLLSFSPSRARQVAAIEPGVAVSVPLFRASRVDAR